MVDFILGLGLALPIAVTSGISVTTGVAQGVNEQHKQNADTTNAVRMLKFHLDVRIDAEQRKGKAANLHNNIVTLYSDKVWIEPQNADTGWPVNSKHHPFTGFYIAYPDDNRPYTRGIVSTISVDPPMLNWVYVDKDTYELKYASRSGSIAHHVGDFDWTGDEDGSSVTFDEFEGFLAVEEEPGVWALYFDMDDDGLKSKRKGKKVVEVSLVRRVITGQEVNKWGLKEDGNIGFKSTKEIDKISERKQQREQERQREQEQQREQEDPKG